MPPTSARYLSVNAISDALIPGAAPQPAAAAVVRLPGQDRRPNPPGVRQQLPDGHATRAGNPPGSEAIRLRISSRSRRFTRLRTTAEPTARLTTKPTFGPASLGTGPAGNSSAPETTEPPARRPARNVRRNSSELLIRVCCGSTTPPAQPWLPARLARWRAGRSGAQLLAALAAARGEHGTAGRVRIRSRKPWTFARRRLFGWNVRLLTGAPETRCGRKGQTCGTSRGQILARPRPGSPYRRDRVSLLTVKAIRCAGQTEPPRTARSCSFAAATIMEHCDFHSASAAGDLGCGKSTSAGRPGGASCRQGAGETAVQRTYTPCGRTCGQRVAVSGST